jgi:nucleotidyltransferase/DNA polymerase involved in DNA repair
MTNSITDISGIGTSTAATLAKHGIKTAKDLANATIEKIVSIPGFSQTRADRVKKDAISLLDKEQSPKAKKQSRPRKPPASSKGSSKQTTTSTVTETDDEVITDIVEAMEEAHDDVEESLSDEDEIQSHEALASTEQTSAVNSEESSSKEESVSDEPEESLADNIEPILLDAVMVETEYTHKDKIGNRKKGKKKKKKKKKKGKKNK